jgi:amino acid adenylation domain-containing protein
MVEHVSVINILLALQKEYPLKESDTYLLKTSYLFDVSVTELFGWFLDGGRLAVFERGGEKDPQSIINAIRNWEVTHINFVPSMFNAFVEILTPQHSTKLSSLKYIFLAGEALIPGLVEKFRQLGMKILLENIYGPTEATVYAAKYSLSAWNGSGSIPIGKPLQNIKLYILDNYDYLQPIGTAGELCIGGAGLARGYLNRPELTAGRFKRAVIGHSSLVIGNSHKFFPNDRSSQYPTPPFTHSPLYKTGDLARWLDDGNIEFLGRIDHQVKIRGYRIELGEIESQLMKHKEIKEAVVLAGSNENGDRYLCAYVEAVLEINVSGLKEYLQGCLPGYMIPSEFVRLEQMPLTGSGKIDRQKLKSMGKKLRAGGEHVAPRTANEIIIAEVWKKILKLEQVSINDNFFDIGGTSIDIIRANSQLKKALKQDIPILAMYRYTTIDSLTRYIGAGNRDMENNPGNARSRARADKIKKGREDKNKRREIRARRHQ